jgi:membrane protease YdiL (CAAX protease family)
MLTHRVGPRAAVRELALDGPVPRALLFALAVSSPMLVGLALTRHMSSDLVVTDLIYFEAVAPFAEEVLFRGYAFRQLHLRAGWPFLAAVLLTSVMFGLGHIEKGTTSSQVAAIFFITGVGGAFFAWLLLKWDNLWVPFFTHLFMNQWWDLFGVGETAWGGWFPLSLQIATMSLAVALTLYLKRAGRRAISAAFWPGSG